MTAPKPLTPAVKAEVLAVAARLERCASDLRERAERPVQTNLHDLLPEHARTASDVVKTIQSLMGNLNLDDLVNAASKADREARA